MKIDKWLKERGETKAWLAKELEMSRAGAGDLLNGDVVPRAKTMIKVFALSGGEVTPNDFYDLPDLKKK